LVIIFVSLFFKLIFYSNSEQTEQTEKQIGDTQVEVEVEDIQQEEFCLDMYIERAEERNEQQVIHDDSLNYPYDLAGDEIEKRVNKVWYEVKKQNNTKVKNEDIFIDIYAIIEHETRWVNYRYLDEGRGFGIGSMLYSTAQSLIDEPEYILQSDVGLQIKLTVKYYMKLLNHFSSRDFAIIGYNRGYEFELYPSSYIYWNRVNDIREEMKGGEEG